MRKSIISRVLLFTLCSLSLILLPAAASLAAPSPLTLSTDNIIVGQTTATLTVNAGVPPYQLQQTGGSVGVNIKQSTANSFTLSGRGRGNAILTVFDGRRTNLGSKTLTIDVPPVTMTLTPDTFTIGSTPSVLKITGGLTPYLIRQTGGTIGAYLDQTGLDSFNTYAMSPGTAVLSLVDQSNGIIASTTLTIKAPAATLTITPETVAVGGAPAVLKVSGAASPFSVRQTAGASGVNIQQTAADTFTLQVQAPGSATISLFDRFGNNLGSKSLTVVVPQATLTLSPEALTMGPAPAVLKIGGGLPPFSVRQTAGTVGVSIQQTAADTFNISGSGPGNATLTVYDRSGAAIGSRNLTVNAVPLAVALSTETIAVNGPPALLKITSGIPPYYVRQTGGTVGVGIQQIAADQFSISGRGAGSALLTVGDRLSGRSVDKNLTVK